MKNLSYLLAILLILNSCTKDKVINSNTNNQTVSIQLNSYPLTIGNSWKYSTEAILTDSIGTNILQQNFDNYWKVISDTIINGQVAAKISQLDSNYNGATNLAFSYYANQPDGFYGIADENFGSMFFLRSSRLQNPIQIQMLSTFGNEALRTDTVFLPDTSLYLMKFPSVINDLWPSHEYGIPNLIKRKWLSYESISTSAGTFNCIKLQAFWDNNNDNLPDSSGPIIYQYFSDKGLIKETRFIHLTFSDGSTGEHHQSSQLVQINF